MRDFVPVSPVATTSNLVAVMRVVDGDTIDIAQGEQVVRVRLIGINTPETVDPRRPVECFGKEASLHAQAVLEGQWVRIEGDEGQDTYDKYGRLLAYVYLSDGTLFNKQMIADGYAYEYTYRLPYKFQKVFKEAERSAREEGKGLWASGVCDEQNRKHSVAK